MVCPARALFYFITTVLLLFFYFVTSVFLLCSEHYYPQVKMKCKQADSPSTVSLYLLEPKTCEYVLGVESPLVCDLLNHADDHTGLFPEGTVYRKL